LLRFLIDELGLAAALAGTLFCALVLVLLYNVPIIGSQTLLAGYIMVLLLVYATAYTVFSVPYLAMPAEMSADPHERSVIISYRVYASSAAALIAVIAGLVCWWLTRHAPFTLPVEGEQRSFFEDVHLSWQNRPFVWLLGAKITMLFGVTAHMAAFAFYTRTVILTHDGSLGTLLLVQTLASVCAVPLWLRASRAWGKRTAYCVAAVAYGFCVQLWLGASADESFRLHKP
jgi:GPH family glycoside/pentoside/hexuronide:cation symporter